MRTLLVLAIILSSFPALALGQDASALISEGVALREQGRDAEALERFTQAHHLAPSGRALAQIALAEQALGQLVAAEAHLADALEESRDPFIRRNRALLEQALDEIRAGIGELAVSGGVPGAVISVNGEDRATLPIDAPLRLARGTAHVVVSADGYAPFEADVDVTGGARSELAVVLRPVAPTAPAPEPEPEPDAPPASNGASWMLPTGIALAGVGAVGLGVGTALAIVREDHARARQVCSDVDPACRDRYQAALDAETGAIAAFVAGGILAAGGAALLALELLDDGEPEDATLACAPGVLAISCGGRF